MTTAAPASTAATGAAEAPAGAAPDAAAQAAEAARQTAAANAANQASAAAAAAANPPAPNPAAPLGNDPEGKPWTTESALAELAKVRQEAGKKRATSKNVVDALRAVAAEVGIELPDGEPTVESLTATLQEAQGTTQAAQEAADKATRERVFAEEAWKAGIPYDRATYLSFLLSQNPAVSGGSVDAASLDVFRGTVASTITTLRGSDPVLQAAGGGQGASGPDQFGGANGTTAVTQEQFEAMSYEERLAIFQKNPEEYKRLAAR